MATEGSDYPMGNPMLNKQSSSGGTGNADTVWNQGWNEGFNNPTRSSSYYMGSGDQNWSSGYLAGQAEYAKRNSGSVLGAKTGGGNGGNGGGSNPPSNIDIGSNQPDYNAELERQYGLIDQESQNSLNYLGDYEKNLISNQSGIEQNILNQANVLKGTAQTNRMDAQNNARRLYNELQMGYRQRFGGASSAGEAAQAITNVEQQRQMAQNDRTYQAAVAQVDLSANQAIQSAQSEFRSQLLEISKNRTAVESDKINARRQALSDLSNKVFTIQQQRQTFKDNLALMAEQARLQNNASISSLNSTDISNDVNPTSTLTPNFTTQTTGNGINTAVGFRNFRGYEDPYKKQSIMY